METERSIGFDQPLYVLPFDHRVSLETKMFGFEGPMTPDRTAEIARAKDVIYDAFKKAIANGVAKEKACVLVDEQFGAAILRDCAAQGYAFAASVEKSGEEEFVFEYDEQFADHIAAFRPTFAKVLVRYNPRGDRERNGRQASQLKRLSTYLHGRSKSRFMFEMLVPAEKEQLDRLGGDPKAFDRELRPSLMVEAIHELQEAGVEPDVWKVEGLERREDCARIVSAARRAGRGRVGCIVLGRGAEDAQVRRWLVAAAGVEGFIGFAVGRTDFWQPLVDWRGGVITREEAVGEMAGRYREFVELFERSKGAASEREKRS